MQQLGVPAFQDSPSLIIESWGAPCGVNLGDSKAGCAGGGQAMAGTYQWADGTATR